VAQDVGVVGVEVAGGLFQVLRDGLQPRAAHQGHEGDLEGDEPDDHVEHAALEGREGQRSTPESHGQGRRRRRSRA
jgi:hypothetical protein